MAKRCVKCRKEMDDELFICPHCGEPVYKYKKTRVIYWTLEGEKHTGETNQNGELTFEIHTSEIVYIQLNNLPAHM